MGGLSIHAHIYEPGEILPPGQIDRPEDASICGMILLSERNHNNSNYTDDIWLQSPFPNDPDPRAHATYGVPLELGDVALFPAWQSVYLTNGKHTRMYLDFCFALDADVTPPPKIN